MTDNPDLVGFAVMKGYLPKSPVEPFLDEIRAARDLVPPISWPIIVSYLQEVHGVKTTETTLRRKVGA